MPSDNSASIWMEYADSVFFCLFNTVVFSCFVCISAECPFRFLMKFVAGVGNVMARKRKIVNTTPHTSHFLIDLHAHAWLKSCVCRAHIMCHESSPCARVFVLTLFDYSTFLSHC